MRKNKRDINIGGNSALAIAAGCAVAFMFIVTIISIVMYKKQMNEVSGLLADREYDEYQYYVAFITGDDDADFWKSVYMAAKKSGEEQGVYVDMLSDSLNVEYSKEQLMEMAIHAGCDGIFVEGGDSRELTKLINEAHNKGIAVVTMLTDADGSKRDSYVGINSYAMARLYADQLSYLVDVDAEEPAEVMVLEGANTDEGSVSVLVTGIQEAVAEYGEGISNVAFNRMAIEDAEAFSTEEFVQNLFQTQELPAAIICLDELTTTCVYQAMIDYNKVGKVQLLGYYKSNVILEGIKQGVIDAVVNIDTDNMGAVAVGAFSEFKSTGYVSDYLMVNTDIVTQDNVDEYRQEVGDE